MAEFVAMPWRRRGAGSPRDEFADEVIGLIQDLLGLRATRLGDFALQIGRPDGPPVVMNLQNVYAEAQVLEGDTRARHLRTSILAMYPTPRPTTWNEVVPRLLPAVRAVSWLAAAAGPAELAQRPA